MAHSPPSVAIHPLRRIARRVVFLAVALFIQLDQIVMVAAQQAESTLPQDQGGDGGQVFGGPVPTIQGLASGNVRTGLTNTLKFFLSFLTLVATIFVIVGGIRILASGGSEEQLTKGRKTVVYAIIGLLVVFFSALLISFFTVELANQFQD